MPSSSLKCRSPKPDITIMPPDGSDDAARCRNLRGELNHCIAEAVTIVSHSADVNVCVSASPIVTPSKLGYRSTS